MTLSGTYGLSSPYFIDAVLLWNLQCLQEALICQNDKKNVIYGRMFLIPHVFCNHMIGCVSILEFKNMVEFKTCVYGHGMPKV